MAIYASVRVPNGLKWNPHAAIGLMTSIVERFQLRKETIANHVTELEIVAYSGVIEWNFFTTLTDNVNSFAAIIQSFYPGAEVYSNGVVYPTTYPIHKKTGALGRSYDISAVVPGFLSAANIRSNSDPLVHLTQAMNQLNDQEIVVYRMVIADYEKRKMPWWAKALVLTLDEVARQNNPMKLAPSKDQERLLVEARRKIPLVNVAQSLEFYTFDQDRFYILDNIIGTFRGFTDNGYPLYDHYYPHIRLIESQERLGSSFQYYDAIRFLGGNAKNLDFLMTPDEMAALWHLPHEGFTADRIDVIRPDLTKLPDALKGVEGTLIGYSNTDEVRLPVEDRNAHTIVIGKTRVGKSSLIHSMVHDDIQCGKGFCLIDPHGELVRNILRSSIPDHRMNDVVIIDVANRIDGKFYPPALNPMTSDADVLAATMLRVYPDLAGTRMDRWLGLALKTLKFAYRPTIWDIQRIFEDDDYRERVLQRSKSIALKRSWENYEKTKPGDRESSLNALFSRLDSFYTSDELLAITCNPLPFNINQYIAENKIILVSLGGEGSKIGQSERAILGTSLVSQVYTMAMSGGIPEAIRPYMLYIDEAHFFKTAPLQNMLSEIGKKGLGLFLADQYLNQLADTTQQALEGNVGTIISFEIGSDDLHSMSTYMSPQFQKEDLAKLGKYKAAVSMRDPQGNRAGAFLLETVSPPQPNDVAEGDRQEQLVRRQSAQHLGLKPFSDVLQLIQQADADTQEDTLPPENIVDDDNNPKDDDDFVEQPRP